jgi:membrane associated rhomboid family serine protease
MFPLRDDQPLYSKPIICTLLIILNVVVFLHEMQLEPFSRNYFVAHYGLVPSHLRFPFTPLITSQFLHAGWMHIIGNMIFLWAFGRSLEDAMGSGKFLLFYLASGVLAGATQVFFNPESNLPMVGASGAIAGVMGAYLIKFPRARILTLVFLIFITRVEIPAMLYLPYWFITQLLNGYGTVAYSHLREGGTAWFAHIGGFIAGMILVTAMGTENRYRHRRLSW